MNDFAVMQAIESARMHPLRWGIDDCCLWAADLVAFHSKVDIAAPFRGYVSRLGAAKALYLYAGGGLTEAAARRAQELELEPVARPYRGDALAVVASRNGPFLGLHWRGHWLGRGPEGEVYFPLWYAVAAWKFPPRDWRLAA